MITASVMKELNIFQVDREKCVFFARTQQPILRDDQYIVQDQIIPHLF